MNRFLLVSTGNKQRVKGKYVMEYVIITGASIENLGAESMTCIAIHHAKMLVPECEIILASTDKKGMQGKIKYKVCRYNFPTELPCHKNTLFGQVIKMYSSDIEEPLYEKILPETKYIIDVSGYALTTKFGMDAVYGYLNRIFVASKYKIPILICSQSFGPITYKSKMEKAITNHFLRKYLKYPEIIEARENAGFQFLHKYTRRNITLKPDMVLLYKNRIAYEELRKLHFDKNLVNEKCIKGVAIIPNEKIITKTTNGNKYLDTLKVIIKYLIEKEINVSVVVHCELDKQICEKMKKCFNDKIQYFDCTQYGSSMYDFLIDKFDFIIASRYHSIIHAYRKYIPAVALGWEDKYNELFAKMEQADYIIDYRKEITNDLVIAIINKMIQNNRLEKKHLKSVLSELRDKYE